MNILIVNDDGYGARGIETLKRFLAPYGNIYIIAPDHQRSGASHSFTYKGPFHLIKQKENEYTLDALPVDCVRLAKALNVKFDLVFSGINDGLNLGTDVLYSGTVGAAREAIIEGIPSIAISTDMNSFEIVESELKNILKLVFEKKLYSKDYVLNINFPTKDFKKSVGIKVAKVGKKIFDAKIIEILDGYDIAGEFVTLDTDKATDVYLSLKGYTTLVPVGFDETNYLGIDDLKNKLGGD